MPTWKPSSVRFRAMYSDDGGEPFIEGLLQAKLPDGVKFIGNGTCPHPLNVEFTGKYAVVNKALASLTAFVDLADAGNATGEEELRVLNNAKAVLYLAKGGVKFARKCSITGKGMNEGWCFGDGEEYAATREMAAKIAEDTYGCSFDEAVSQDEDNDGEALAYWTEWEVDEENEGWYMADGTFIEPTNAAA